ncbi:MAG: hypothetical protein IKG40_00445 [Bacilli bacterium]|nr:hypothetical protein [Bacilli bacterium]
MPETLEQFNQKLDYLGYKGINIEKVSLKNFENFINIMPYKNNTVYTQLSSLPPLPLEEIKKLTKEYYQKYFSLNDILYSSIDKLQKNMNYFSLSQNTTEFYDKVNSNLTKINPLNLNIKLVGGHSMVGKIQKPLILCPLDLSNKNRKVYFSNIELGNQLTKLSVGTLVHEIAHSQQEQNIGYAEDYLNKEIISIFLEKIVALEMDPTGKLLKISEQIRFNDILDHYYNLLLNKQKLTSENTINNLLFIKSTFYAEKLFDMYLNERKQKNKDKYFSQIQDIFDGKITVEDLIKNRNITPGKTQDLSLLKRHIK